MNSGAMVTSLAYSANGRQLCAGLKSGIIQVFNLSSKAQQFALETQTVLYLYLINNSISFVYFLFIQCAISCMEFSPNGQYLAVGTSDGNIELWKS